MIAFLLKALWVIAWLAATGYVLNQVRKPSKWLGRLFLKNMNARHSAVTDWGLAHVEFGAQRAILDVGCGGGRTLEKLAGLAPGAHIVGVDYAPGSVAESRAHNAALIAAGRIEVVTASVSQLPGATGRFDLVTAIETHYYWPNLVEDLSEIRRVLRPGGTLVLIAETYLDGQFGWLVRLAMAPLRAAILSAEEHRALLVSAGYEGIEVTTDRRRGWICAVASAPGFRSEVGRQKSEVI